MVFTPAVEVQLRTPPPGMKHLFPSCGNCWKLSAELSAEFLYKAHPLLKRAISLKVTLLLKDSLHALTVQSWGFRLKAWPPLYNSSQAKRATPAPRLLWVWLRLLFQYITVEFPFCSILLSLPPTDVDPRSTTYHPPACKSPSQSQSLGTDLWQPPDSISCL